jgi:hypothetical protein
MSTELPSDPQIEQETLGPQPKREAGAEPEVPKTVEFIPTPKQAATFNARFEQTIEQNPELSSQR